MLGSLAHVQAAWQHMHISYIIIYLTFFLSRILSPAGLVVQTCHALPHRASSDSQAGFHFDLWPHQPDVSH